MQPPVRVRGAKHPERSTFELMIVLYINRMAAAATKRAGSVKDFRAEFVDHYGHISADGMCFEFKPVVATNTHGRASTWVAIVSLINAQTGAPIAITPNCWTASELPNMHAVIKINSGLVDGKTRDTAPTIVRTGKNAGKSNARNVFTQALSDVLGKYNKQGRVARVDDAVAGVIVPAKLTKPMLPMLSTQLRDVPAPDFTKRVFVQRKYNGLRCVAQYDSREASRVLMHSRTGIKFSGFPYIKRELEAVFDYYEATGVKLRLDGELYAHKRLLQDISGYARRDESPTDFELHYMVYDCYVENKPELVFSERHALLCDLFARFPRLIYARPVETIQVRNMEEVNELYTQYLREEYEGAMIRLNEPYRQSPGGYHSRILIKMKPRLDAEYRIIGWSANGKGKNANALMLRVEIAPGGASFDVTPAAELERRKEIAAAMPRVEANDKTHFENAWLGRYLVVYYDELSKDNVPLRATTKLELREPGL